MTTLLPTLFSLNFKDLFNTSYTGLLKLFVGKLYIQISELTFFCPLYYVKSIIK